MKVRWIDDGWDPVYLLTLDIGGEDSWKRIMELDIPEEKYKEYVCIMEEFDNMQDYIEDAIEAQRK